MNEAPLTRRSGARQAVTSAAQDGLWFEDQVTLGAPAQNLCRVYRVTGDFSINALRAAWIAVVARQESLRTTLVVEDGQLVQLIAEDSASSFVDVGSVPPGSARRLGDELAATGLDLAAGPLARLTVGRMGVSEHLVVLVVHRAVADEDSIGILVSELSAWYDAEVHGGPPAAALTVQYTDFAQWQRNESSNRLAPWWADELTPAPQGLSLPVDRARPAGPSTNGGRLRFDWGSEFADPLAELCAAANTTPLVVLLSAFQTLLYRYGDSERLAVGIPVSVRPPAFEGVIGAFSNLVVVCADFSGRPSFRELIGRVDTAARRAVEHRALPFDQLVRELNVERDPRTIPLCEVTFTFRPKPEPVLRLVGANVRPEHASTGAVRTDLTLTVDRIRTAVAGSLDFRRDLFEPSSVRGMLAQLRILLDAALRDPELPVGSLPLDPVRQTRAAVRESDRIVTEPPVERPAHEIVHAMAASHPAAIAIATGEETVSYRELVERAGLITRALRSGDGVAGRPVAVRMSRGARQVATLLGVLDAGAHLVCLSAGDVGHRARAILEDIQPSWLLLDGAAPDDELVAWYREELGGEVLDIAVLGSIGATQPEHTGTRLSALAYVAYTSGSTGRPKGIPQSHATLAQFVGWLSGQFGMGPGARVAQWAEPSYDASLMEIFSALVGGATLYPVPDKIRVNPEKLVDWLVAERITVLQTVPSFARELLKAIIARDAADKLTALDHLLLAGEALPGELANALRATLPGTRLINLYGPTESILATWHEISGPVHGMTPIGASIPGRQVLVLDEWDRPSPVGTAGQVVIRGPYVTPGYVGAAAGDRRPFQPLDGDPLSGVDAGPCYRTGDFARRRWDGALEFRGRGDFQIKIQGIRVELSDIETTLAAHESIAECAVLAVRNPDGQVTQLVAYVVPQRGPDGKAVVADVWRSHLRRWFGSTRLPVSFKTVLGLPRNAGGKVDRARLPAPGPSVNRTARPPKTPVEGATAAIWSELLGVEQFDTDDTFFALGGHSLLLPVLLQRIRDRFGVELSVWEFFDNPTVLGLSCLIDEKTVSTIPVTETVMGEKYVSGQERIVR